jgi:hypothetical protein
MPVNTTNGAVFAYGELLAYMGERAAEAGLTFPHDPYLIDVSLCNPFE